MEAELLWRRLTLHQLRGLRLLRLAEFVRYNRAVIGGPGSQWTHSYQAASAQRKPQSYQVDV